MSAPELSPPVPTASTIPVAGPVERRTLPQLDLHGRFTTQIGIVCFGTEVPSARISLMVAELNSSKDCFQYVMLHDTIESDQEYDGVHCYTNDFYFNHLNVKRSQSQKSNIRFMIGVTHDGLDGDRFNVHDQVSGFGMVTMHDNEKYKPAGMSLEQYLAYLILCESFCLVGAKHYEHHKRLFDVFDECKDKQDFRKCLEKVKISPISRTKLIEDGFPVQAGERILQYTRRISPVQVLKQLGQSSIITLIAGAVLGQTNILLPAWLQAPAAYFLVALLAGWVAISVARNYVTSSQAN
jgi:hypothetical protein